jgi:nucleoside triphosphate diphosphatase
MKRLLAPDGCPWDREQTLDTLRSYLIEETYEVLEAIEHGTPAEHCDELGDLLMQIVFQSELRAAEGAFDVDDVVRAIRDKLVRRHPHVFGDAKVENSAEVLAQWQELKEREKADKKQRRGTLEGIPRALPALTRALRLSERAAQVGFDWPDVAGCRAKVAEECAEVDQAIASRDPARPAQPAQIEGEIGDLLFAIVSLARKLGHDPEAALRGANAKFERRFAFIEDRLRERGRTPKQSNLDEMDALWNEAKQSSNDSVTKK